MHKQWIASLALVVAVSAGAQQAAHEHGVAELRVALDGGTLLIEFESPLDSLVGFEHEPATAAQWDALADAEGRLKDFSGLFRPDTTAACVLTEAHVEPPFAEHEAEHKAGSSDAHTQQQQGHSEIFAVYQLECARPEAMSGMDVGLLEAFPRIRSLHVQTVTPRGQAAVRLRKGDTRLAL